MSRGQGHGRGKSFLSDQQIKIQSKKSTGYQDGGPSSSTSTYNSSDEELNQRGRHNHLSGKNQLDEKYTNTKISSNNNSGAVTLIKFDVDVTLKIKEEVIYDQENIGQRLNIKYGSKLCSLDARKADVMSRNIISRHFQEVHVSIPEPEKKYKCENCARSYTQKRSLNRHKKFGCDVIPQFNCKFCGMQFKHKNNMNRHILRVHQKTNSKASQARHNCNKCSRSYSSADTLSQHKRLKHAIVKTHVSIPESEMKCNCEKCARSFVHAQDLYRHKKFQCGVIPQFICEFCGKQFKLKGDMKQHIHNKHKSDSKASQKRHNCDKYPRCYSWPSALYQHKQLEHAAFRPQFICDFCGFSSARKYCLSQHITSHHLQKIDESVTEPEKKYKCEMCARSYIFKHTLNLHKKYECDVIVIPQFSCEFCSKQFNLKSTMNVHIRQVHQKTDSNASKTGHNIATNVPEVIVR